MEIADIIKDVKQYIQDIKDGKITKEESIRSLQRAGILDENGDLAPPYNGKEIVDNGLPEDN